jgi:two-component system chemotaxis sensor kinase CheA
MTPLLQEFLSEARDFLQSIAQDLMKLEKAPGDPTLMSDLFRSVHTLKGNSGLFEFPEMTRVLHAAEDLMSEVREGRLAFGQGVADRLLDAMDFVGVLLDELERGGGSAAAHAAASASLAESLRQLIPVQHDAAADSGAAQAAGPADAARTARAARAVPPPVPLDSVPDALRAAWTLAARGGAPPLWVIYSPAPDCFFKGEDPFYLARQTPQILWQRITAPAPWPSLAELDPYQCALRFDLVTNAPRAALDEQFRYVTEQVTIVPLTLAVLESAGGGSAALSAAPSGPGTGSPAPAAVTNSYAKEILDAQLTALGLPDDVAWLPGRLRGIAATLAACYRSTGRETLLPGLDAALASALAAASARPLKEWAMAQSAPVAASGADKSRPIPAATDTGVTSGATLAAAATNTAIAGGANPTAGASNGGVASGATPAAAAAPPHSADAHPMRRADDAVDARPMLKVDQGKIDRLMSLIGEMVVAKNGLPFLAGRAESVYGVRDLAREIKTQYSVINRIAEEMQDSIMQVRMMPVSGVLQRFPRLVRDISHKLGKQVELVLEGEATEADKNIVEALGDPLVHIIRNSLDHGIEMPEVRRAAGKPAVGRLVIHASQDSGRVQIDISDDGSGIDPAVIKRKAYEKGMIDEATLERMSDQDAINLVFMAGLSTNEKVTDLSGRGVGMDVVRSAVERVNGSVSLTSEVGKGTRLRLSLPLSMAVTNVMVIESNKQIFGVPMEIVLETVRIPRGAIHSIKNRQTIVLRGRILPLRSLNELLADDLPQVSNELDEMATLVVQIHGESLGIVVDDFREVVDIILKPMGGILHGVAGYSGSALLGDGSVLMVLNPKELVTWQ